VSRAITSEPIEMPFGVGLVDVDPKNRVVDGVQISTREGERN